eukprot:4245945-Pyramimonas_sp.AAC.2
MSRARNALVLQQQGLEAGKGGADAEVDLLTGVHRVRLVLVRAHQIPDGVVHLAGHHRGEARAIYVQVGISSSAYVDDLSHTQQVKAQKWFRVLVPLRVYFP